jgi:hypothetical protein
MDDAMDDAMDAAMDDAGGPVVTGLISQLERRFWQGFGGRRTR